METHSHADLDLALQSKKTHLSHHHANEVRIFGLNLKRHYNREVIWAPYDQKLILGKSLIEGFLRSRPHVPHFSPLGPKFGPQKFSHIILKWCYFMSFVDLFWRKCRKLRKTGLFLKILQLNRDLVKITCFLQFSTFSP